MTAGTEPAADDGRPLRLAVLVGTVSGGTAAHAAALADGCRRAGAQVRVLGPAEVRDRFSPDLPFTAVQIGARPRPASDAGAIRSLRRLLRAQPAGQEPPDVVHAHGVRAGAFAALALPRQAPRPALVVTVHNAPPEGRLNKVVYGTLERLCARRGDAVLCASPDLVDRMRELGATGAQQFDVPASLPAPPSAAAVAQAAADIGAGGRPVVLAVGRLTEQKGFDVLVAAAARWREVQRAPRTVIAGDGPMFVQLAAQIRQSGADVLLLGARDDVPALLATADVFVLSSRWEARALVLQEAMRAGRAIVATAAGGTPGLTGNDAAVLVPPGDDAALAEAVLAVLADPAAAAGLGLAARARAATFPSPEDAVRQALAIYRSLAVTHCQEPAAPGSLS
jgi:glycosyltransferase involved in cell wall biosynthesis